MDPETISYLTTIDSHALKELICYIARYVDEAYDYYVTEICIAYFGIRRKEITCRRCSPPCDWDWHEYKIPWDYVFEGRIEDFMGEEDARRKKEQEEKAKLAFEAAEKQRKEQEELKELQERQLFERLKVKYES